MLLRTVRYVKVRHLHGLLGQQCPLGLRKATLLLSHVLQRLVQTRNKALEEGATLKSGTQKEIGRGKFC